MLNVLFTNMGVLKYIQFKKRNSRLKRYFPPIKLKHFGNELWQLANNDF